MTWVRDPLGGSDLVATVPVGCGPAGEPLEPEAWARRAAFSPDATWMTTWKQSHPGYEVLEAPQAVIGTWPLMVVGAAVRPVTGGPRESIYPPTRVRVSGLCAAWPDVPAAED
ncbi:hypothetical protein [Motilibacter peucedani]|uniref:hypothetical protein n=1 Tax=Motilibacter peucedani TaxID=598650 RepID=UPI0011C47403|nr:hypothetical protein [Motilibacter peucedani]